MDKVGIVTWYKNLNYGGTLQAYALNTVVERLGYDVEFINYQPESSKLKYKLARKVKDIGFRSLYGQQNRVRTVMKAFIMSELKETRVFTEYDELSDYAVGEYKKIICGSDQIWTPYKGFEPFYFLTFARKEQRIAYAPSMGIVTADWDYRTKFQKAVSQIPDISVREASLSVFVKENTGRDAQIVLDPTLLLTKKEWKEFSKEEKRSCILPDKKYILCYLLTKNEKHEEWIQEFGKISGCQIYYISSAKMKLPDFTFVEAGFRDFIKLIENAEYVLTDSYHGMLFGIIFNKKMGIFMRFLETDKINQNSRMDNLITMFGLENMVLSSHSLYNKILERSEDYKRINEILNSKRDDSVQYLMTALKGGDSK